jgi:hypothetical protein
MLKPGFKSYTQSHALGFSGQLQRCVLPEGGRAFADVHDHIKHCSLHHAHQLALRTLDLIKQAASTFLIERDWFS